MDRELSKSLNNLKGYLSAIIGYIDVAKDGREVPKALERASETALGAMKILEDQIQGLSVPP